MARRSLKPQLNQIRTWVRQGRTDAWIAHQLDVTARDISSFKREHELATNETSGNGETDMFGPRHEEEPDLRAEDDALVAAALEAEQDEPDEENDEADAEDEGEGGGDAAAEEGDEGGKPKPRRRGRRGGRGRRRGGARKPLDGTFDHGEEGYGLWLDPAVQDDPVYAEHWAGHRTVTVAIEADRIVITRSGEDAGESGSDGD